MTARTHAERRAREAFGRQVKIEVREVGQHFACKAVLRDTRSGREVAETDLFPYGAHGSARASALAIIEERQWNQRIPPALRRPVKIKVISVDVHCTWAVVRDARTRRKLAETDIYLGGSESTARRAALAIVEERQWRDVEDVSQ